MNEANEAGTGTGPKRRVPLWVWVAAGLAVVAAVVTIVLVATSGRDPISQAEMMARYAKIAPNDTSATPETMDRLAEKACTALAQGISTDRVIGVFTPTAGPRATEVARLLVEYKCPDRLDDFK